MNASNVTMGDLSEHPGGWPQARSVLSLGRDKLVSVSWLWTVTQWPAPPSNLYTIVPLQWILTANLNFLKKRRQDNVIKMFKS